MHAAYHALFTSPDGQKVLHHMLAQAGLLETSHTPGDAHDTAFREGRRSMALDVLRMLRWTPGEIHELATRRTAAALAATEEPV